MKIVPSEIASVEEAGMLDGSPVKLIRMKGGFWMSVGKPRNSIKDEVLAAGSHPAIVKFNLQKMYPGFQPSMMKSEDFNDSVIVEKHSHFLSQELRKSGHDLYSVQEGNKIDFHLTKYDTNVSSVKANVEKDSIVIKNLGITKEFSHALAGATVEKAKSCGAKRVKVGK